MEKTEPSLEKTSQNLDPEETNARSMLFNESGLNGPCSGGPSEAESIANKLNDFGGAYPMENVYKGLRQLSDKLEDCASGDYKQYNQLLNDVAAETSEPGDRFRLVTKDFNNATHTYNNVEIIDMSSCSEPAVFTIVQPGNTLSGIAQNYRSGGLDSQSYQKTLEYNNQIADPNKILVGQFIDLRIGQD